MHSLYSLDVDFSLPLVMIRKLIRCYEADSTLRNTWLPGALFSFHHEYEAKVPCSLSKDVAGCCLCDSRLGGR